jgi:hypothetical protein
LIQAIEFSDDKDGKRGAGFSSNWLLNQFFGTAF